MHCTRFHQMGKFRLKQFPKVLICTYFLFIDSQIWFNRVLNRFLQQLASNLSSFWASQIFSFYNINSQTFRKEKLNIEKAIKWAEQIFESSKKDFSNRCDDWSFKFFFSQSKLCTALRNFLYVIYSRIEVT